MEKKTENKEKDLEAVLAQIIEEKEEIQFIQKKRYRTGVMRLNAKLNILGRYGWELASVTVRRVE